MARGSNSIATVSRLFFDNADVIRKVDQATRRALSRFGSYVRSDAKRSIRSGRKTKRRDKKTGRFMKGVYRPSKPGRPPHNITGKLKGHIYFSYDSATRNVVIGPALFARAKKDNLVMLEHGGTRSMRVSDYGKNVRTVAARYPARPFMQPAFDKNEPKAAQLFKDQVR